MVARSLPDKLRTRPGVLFVLAVVALASVLLYLPSAGYDFVWDDNLLINGNTLLARSGPLDFLGRGFWAGSPDPVEGAAQTYYRPLVSLSFWLDARLSGSTARAFHVTNIILNALCAVVVALVLWELLRSGVWALLGGLLFATHSSHVESVAFISGRTDLLLALFTALASFALLRSLRKRNRWWWLLLVPAFALALLSKETALVFPALVLLAPLLTGTRAGLRHLALFGLTVLVTIGYLWLRSAAVGTYLPASAPGLGARLSNIANTFGLYVRMFFHPFTHRAKFPADPVFLTLTSNTIIALLFVVAVPLAALRRRYWVALFGYAWALLFLLPVTNIVPIGPQAAERLLYLPSAGFVIVIIAVSSRLLSGRPLLRRLAAALVLLATVLLGTDSLRRECVWKDEPTLFAAMVREAPSAPSAYANLADAVAGRHPDSAIGLYNRALTLDQGFVRAYINSATLLSARGDHRRAIHNLRLAGELRPSSVQVHNNLGLAFLAASQPESALTALERGLAFEPSSAQLHLNRAAALTALGRSAAAESSLRRALAFDSLLAAARIILATRFVEQGLADSALRCLSHPAARVAAAAAPLNRLGTLLVAAGDSTRAEDCYARALALDSVNIPTLFNQALLSAARGDSAAARLLAARAHRLRPDLEPVTALYRRLFADR